MFGYAYSNHQCIAVLLVLFLSIMFIQTHRSASSWVVRPHQANNFKSKRLHVVPNAVKSAKRGKNAGDKEKVQTVIVTVEPDGSDAWRLDQVVDMIKDGKVRKSGDVEKLKYYHFSLQHWRIVA